MKILVLSKEADVYSTKRLVEEIENRGEESEVINPFDLYCFINQTTNGHDRIYLRSDEGKSKRILRKDADAIIPRIAGSNFDYGAMVVQQLNENLNIFSTATEFGLRNCSNKFKNAQILSRFGIRVPKQILSHRPNDYKELIDLVDGLPTVGKLQRGSLGDGVFLLNDTLAASTSLRSFEQTGADVILQSFIDTGEIKNDVRVIVIGAETKNPKTFAYKRFALVDDFRSNYTKSKLGEKVEITEEERDMAIRASKLLKMGVCGVDIMRNVKDKNKPHMIECNGSPGLLVPYL